MITREGKLAVYKLALQKVIRDLELGKKYGEHQVYYKVSGLCPIIQKCHNDYFLYSSTLEIYHVPEVYDEILKYKPKTKAKDGYWWNRDYSNIKIRYKRKRVLEEIIKNLEQYEIDL